MKSTFISFCAGLVLFVPSVFAQQSLKIASVSMEELFDGYSQTAEIQREINIERARIQTDSNEKLAKIREIEARLQEIREIFKAKGESIGAKQRQTLLQESEELSQDGKSKERERKQYLQRREQTLNKKLQSAMRGILSEIQRAVNEAAREGNYDYIFDSSGKTAQGIPFVIHARESTDLTEVLLKELNGE